MNSLSIYDTIIIGAGPAGLTASLYASCFHLSHVVIGKVFGGQMVVAPDILNYPGYIEISGKDLTDKMVTQVKARGGELIEDLVVGIKRAGAPFTITTEKGATYEALSIILATGTERKRLNIPGELEYSSKGVHYCVTCERQDYTGKVVAIIGGGNSAAQGALQVAHAAARVIIFARGEQLRADPIWTDQIVQRPNIKVYYNTSILEIIGDGQKVTGVKTLINGKEETVALEKIFIEIGGVPGTSLIVPLGVTVDQGGYVHVDPTLSTNIPGVFAAGDLVSYGFSIEQISSAVGLGARAAASAFSYLRQGRAPSAWGATLIKR